MRRNGADFMAERDALRIDFGVPLANGFKPCPGVGEGGGCVHQGGDHFKMEDRPFLRLGPGIVEVESCLQQGFAQP